MNQVKNICKYIKSKIKNQQLAEEKADQHSAEAPQVSDDEQRDLSEEVKNEKLEETSNSHADCETPQEAIRGKLLIPMSAIKDALPAFKDNLMILWRTDVSLEILLET